MSNTFNWSFSVLSKRLRAGLQRDSAVKGKEGATWADCQFIAWSEKSIIFKNRPKTQIHVSKSERF